MLEPGELLSTMDAKVWADEFMETKARLGEKEFDHAMMLGWFANAIMAGFDEATRRQQATIADLQGQLKAAKAPRMYDCGSCAIGKGFEQRVAQLEQERDAFESHAIDLQADHARVLGLLAQVTEIADMMLKGTECEHDVGLCSCEHRRIVKQAQRSLPAQPAQGGA